MIAARPVPGAAQNTFYRVAAERTAHVLSNAKPRALPEHARLVQRFADINIIERQRIFFNHVVPQFVDQLVFRRAGGSDSLAGIHRVIDNERAALNFLAPFLNTIRRTVAHFGSKGAVFFAPVLFLRHRLDVALNPFGVQRNFRRVDKNYVVVTLVFHGVANQFRHFRLFVVVARETNDDANIKFPDRQRVDAQSEIIRSQQPEFVTELQRRRQVENLKEIFAGDYRGSPQILPNLILNRADCLRVNGRSHDGKSFDFPRIYKKHVLFD